MRDRKRSVLYPRFSLSQKFTFFHWPGHSHLFLFISNGWFVCVLGEMCIFASLVLSRLSMRLGRCGDGDAHQRMKQAKLRADGQPQFDRLRQRNQDEWIYETIRNSSGPGAIIFQSVAGPTFAFSHGPLCVLLTAGKETWEMSAKGESMKEKKEERRKRRKSRNGEESKDAKMYCRSRKQSKLGRN